FLLQPLTPRSTLYPYTTLFRSPGNGRTVTFSGKVFMLIRQARPFLPLIFMPSEPQMPSRHERRKVRVSSSFFRRNNTSSNIRSEDRKSTRLNSSHVKISYAVFC